MSPNVTPPRAGMNSGLSARKGSGRRYPVQVDLRYKLFQNGTVIERGQGKTREFYDGKIVFLVDRKLSAGADLELSIDWPLRIDGVCPLQLVVIGHIVASDREGSTLKITSHEFRTRGSQVMAPPEAVDRSGFQIHVGTTAIHARRG